MNEDFAPGPPSRGGAGSCSWRERARELVAAARLLLDWAAVPDDVFSNFERFWYLSYAPERLRTALGACEADLVPAAPIPPPADPEDLTICMPGPYEWGISTIRRLATSIWGRWAEQERRYWESLRDYVEAAGEEGEGADRVPASWGVDLEGIPFPELPPRAITAEERARLWHAAAVLEYGIETSEDPHRLDGDPGWIVGLRTELNVALGKSRNYPDYLERCRDHGELELMRCGERYAIYIRDAVRREEVRARLQVLRAGGTPGRGV